MRNRAARRLGGPRPQDGTKTERGRSGEANARLPREDSPDAVMSVMLVVFRADEGREPTDESRRPGSVS